MVVPDPPFSSFGGGGVAPRTPASRSEADAIRVRLLYKLGFYDRPGPADAARRRTIEDEAPRASDGRKHDGRTPSTGREETPREAEAAARKSELPPAARLAPIKFEGGGGGSPRRGRAGGGTVRFRPAVVVVPIPSRRSYSPRARERMHTSPEELAAAAVRNTYEFAYEGWDWRGAVEEAGMYVCGASGDYVHPAHVRFGRRANPYR